MPILIYFLIILLIIRLTKLDTKFSILLAIVITYFSYKSTKISDTLTKITSTISGSSKSNKVSKDNIPEIVTKEWYIYWRKYLADLKEYNHENYFDMMKSLKHFHQLYNEIFIGLDMPKQHIDNLVMLQKEILNLMQSTIHKLPVTRNETLENILNQKLYNLKEELDFRLKEMRDYVNKDWNAGKISYLSQPIYPNELSSLPVDYSSNFSFF